MGNVYIAAKALFDGLKVDYVLPELNSKEAIELGSLYSPEEICLPFKIMIGNYIESIKKGADTIILTGSCGPCRFGEYAEMQMKLLRKLGYDVDFIVIDYPGDIGFTEFLRRIGRIASGSSNTSLQKMIALQRAVRVINSIDKLEARAHRLAGYENKRGECKSILNRCKAEVMKSSEPEEMIRIIEGFSKEFDNMERNDKANPVRIAIIGEIYTVIEPYANLYIEDKLMDFGVSTSRMLTPSWWVKNTVLSPLGINSRNLKKASSGYLPHGIGGHARECIGEAVIAAENGFDGAIQILPMGCMPEIVSKSILPSISRDKDFPIMTLVVDEMTGEAGYITRIEAFVDLLERRRYNVQFGN